MAKSTRLSPITGKALLQVNPDFTPGPITTLAMPWPASEQIDEAITALPRKALQVDPNYAEAHNNLGLSNLFGGGKVDEAIIHYRRAIEIQARLRQCPPPPRHRPWLASDKLTPRSPSTGKRWKSSPFPDLVGAALQPRHSFGWNRTGGRVDHPFSESRGIQARLRQSSLQSWALALASRGKTPARGARSLPKGALELATAQNDTVLVDTIQAQIKNLRQ